MNADCKPSLRQQLRAVAAFAPSDVAAIIEQALSRIAELEASEVEATELHADDQQAISLWALYQRKAKQEIHRLETELAESQWLCKRQVEANHELETKLAESFAMWKGSLEVQGELEQKIARQAVTIHERQQSWRQMKDALRQMYDSAVPNAKEHPTMFAAWKIAEEALNRRES